MRASVGVLGLILIVAWLTGCACACCSGGTQSEPVDEPAAALRDSRSYAFVFIRTGPLREPTEQQSMQAMRGHMANMQRLAADETLLMAGPLGEPRSDPDHRGIFVFDADTAAKGLALANTDPAVEMGVFVMEPCTLVTDAPLTELPRLEREDEQRRLADPDVPDQWVGRPYVLATAPYDPALDEGLVDARDVLVRGRLRSADGSERLILWLDATTPSVATGMLPEGAWTLHGWYGSPTIAQL